MRFTLGLAAGIALATHLRRARWWRRTLWRIFGNGA